MSVTEQFAGLDMQNLIGAPLTAAADASVSLARSTADFINDVGFEADGKVRTAAFGYEKRTANEDGTSNLEEMKVAVPILAIVPIPNLQIDEVNVLFDMEVKQSEKSESSKDLGASLSGSARFGPVKVSVTGSVSAHSSNTRSSDNSAKYHVDVRATNHGTPEGLSRVLDMMSACVSPVVVGSELKDGNGQNLTEAAKARAEKLKAMRAEIVELQTQTEAARDSLDSNLQRIGSVASTQQNIYQADLTRLLGNLGDTPEDDVKREAYGDAIAEVNQSWITFRNNTADLIKLVADSGEYDGTKVSALFNLKAFNKEQGTSGEYTETETQYASLAALQKSAADAQKIFDSAEDKLLSKKAEYNNAISGGTLPQESANVLKSPVHNSQQEAAIPKSQPAKADTEGTVENGR